MSIFSDVISYKPKRTAFNLSHEVKTTAKFGTLTPILCQEVLPSDRWKISTESFTRFAPTLAPIMQRINTFEHYYFVPNRIIWRGWEKFISPNENDLERPVMPSLLLDDVPQEMSSANAGLLKLTLTSESTLLDYLGINTGNMLTDSATEFFQSKVKFTLLPLFAYNQIFLDWFADENQIDVRIFRDKMLDFADLGEIKVSEMTDDQVEFFLWLIDPKQRAWEKDYFTSALPNTQRGEDVTLGTGTIEAYTEVGNTEVTVDKVNGTQTDPTGTYAVGYNVTAQQSGDSELGSFNQGTGAQGNITLSGKTNQNLVQLQDADGNLPEVNPVTINELRRAVKLQEFLEKSMRGGYRLIEQIKSHFGVTSSDARLDRAQFLGGDMQKVIVSELSSTADTFDSSDSSGRVLGQYSGHLTEVGNTKRRTFFSEEHGWIFCLFSCLPRTSYCQGLPRQYTRFDWLDFAWPEFAHLGEQEVKNKELFLDTSDVQNEGTFGYQSRYAEYKYIPSQIHGSFRTNLAYWTMSRRFSTPPALSRQFVEVQPNDGSITDAFTVVDAKNDYLFLNCYHKITCVRPLPRFGVPML